MQAVHDEAQKYAPPSWPFIRNLLENFRYSSGHLSRSLDVGCDAGEPLARRHRPPIHVTLITQTSTAFIVTAIALRRFRSIRHHTVHVFGLEPWREIGLPPNIVVHDAVPYAEALNIMKQARVVLNHAPTLTGGGHERVFDALLSGCFVVSTGSEFLAAEFPGGEGIRFYSGDGLKSTTCSIPCWTDSASCDRIRAAQKTVLFRHTMSSRAVELLTLIQERWPDRFGPGNS